METGPKAAPKVLSQKDFAAHRGVQKGTVSKWKAKGFLVLDGDGRVLVEETEWKLDQQPEVYRGGVTHRPIRKADANSATYAQAKPKAAAGKGKAGPKQAAKPRIAARPGAEPTASPTPRPSDGAPDPADFDLDDPNLTTAQAVQRKENFLGLLRKHELEVARKEWVRVEDVGAEVERDYAVVRGRLLAIPGKLAAKLVGLDRAAIDAALFNEISEALSELHAPAAGGGGADPAP